MRPSSRMTHNKTHDGYWNSELFIESQSYSIGRTTKMSLSISALQLHFCVCIRLQRKKQWSSENLKVLDVCRDLPNLACQVPTTAKLKHG